VLRRPESGPPLVLIGTRHPLIERLIAERRFDRPALNPGEGLVQVVRNAFGANSAVVITGSDRRGLARALEQVAERFPPVWMRGKDRTTIDRIEDDVRRFLAARTPAGQGAAAAYKLDRLAHDLAGKDLESAAVSVSVEKAPDGLAEFLRREAAQ